MAIYTYAPNAVIHPQTGEPVQQSSGKVYMPEDTDFISPLTVMNAVGMTTETINVINGASETFTVDGVIALMWVDDNDLSCVIALQPVLPGLIAGGGPGQVLGKITGSDYDVGWVDQTGGSGGGGGGGGGGSGRVDYAVGSSAARPTDDPNILVMWIADSPPVNALVGDLWVNAPA
jgi:hypothetical protein